MKLTKKAQKAILQHAAECYPRECCGLIVKRQYIPCENIAFDIDNFEINPRDIVAAEKIGRIDAIVHSHADGDATLSAIDKQQITRHGIPWVIASYPGGEVVTHEPPGTPLIGREYIHGALDCFTIVKDYYARELGVEIDDFERIDLWWETENDGKSLYTDNFKSQGFIEVDTLQKHDVILCRVQPTKHVNHALIYLGNNSDLSSETSEPVRGDHIVLHHPYLRRSRREIYGPVWDARKAIIVRHISQIEDL